MVDAISEGMVLAVIAGTDTGSNWWLREPMVIMESPSGGGPPAGGLIVALLVLRLAPPLRLSEAVRASRLARLSETLRQQEPRWATGSHQRNIALPDSLLQAWTEDDDADADAEEDADDVSGLWELEQF